MSTTCWIADRGSTSSTLRPKRLSASRRRRLRWRRVPCKSQKPGRPARGAACDDLNRDLNGTERKRRSASGRGQPHLPEHGAAEGAVGVAQGLHDLEVIVAFGDDERRRFAGRLDGGGKGPALALQLGSFLGAVEQDHRRVELVDRKSTRLNSSHLGISYAVFCL